MVCSTPYRRTRRSDFFGYSIVTGEARSDYDRWMIIGIWAHIRRRLIAGDYMMSDVIVSFVVPA
jgi:hypothetical protein